MTTPSNYLNQWRLITNEACWHLTDDNFTNCSGYHSLQSVWILHIKKYCYISPGANELKQTRDPALVLDLFISNQISLIHGSGINWEKLNCLQFCHSSSGAHLNIKMPFYQNGNSYYTDKMVSWLPHLYNGNPYTWNDHLYIETGT